MTDRRSSDQPYDPAALVNWPGGNPFEVPPAYLEDERQCDARKGKADRPSTQERCRERAWIAASVWGTTYSDDFEPDTTELERRYACIHHVREALEWAWKEAAASEGGRVQVEQHERILPSDQAVMPQEIGRLPGMPDERDWRP